MRDQDDNRREILLSNLNHDATMFVYDYTANEATSRRAGLSIWRELEFEDSKVSMLNRLSFGKID